MKVKIGIIPALTKEGRLEIDNNYLQYIENAGAEAVVLPYPAESVTEGAIAKCQGFLFLGGADIDPARYGEAASPMLGETIPDRDAYDFAMFYRIFDTGKPIFGICRGMQMINCALGGTLYQDAPSQHPGIGTHRNDDETVNTFHTVKTLPGSRIEALFGPELQTNSYHHQAIQNLAPGLIATAKADDGIIEAIEHESRPILAVQFHPERLIGEEQPECANMLPLFRHFIELCSK